jgi:membrane protease YdiL (CAAX protease family)
MSTVFPPEQAIESQLSGQGPSFQDVQINESQRRKRYFELILVLFAALWYPILGTVYVLRGGTEQVDNALHQQFRLLVMIGVEVTALAVLFYVLSSRRAAWRGLGWNFRLRDFGNGIGLVIGASLLSWTFYYVAQLAYYSATGHYLYPKSLSSMLGFGISTWSVLFVCLNPFFEELIVRAFLISEIVALGRSRWLAIFLSVAVQVSYHLYQGLANVIPIAVMFLVFSIYYAYSRRVVPVILAHLFCDVYALLRGAI